MNKLNKNSFSFQILHIADDKLSQIISNIIYIEGLSFLVQKLFYNLESFLIDWNMIQKTFFL